MTLPYFRSEDVHYYNLIMPRENAWEILNQLGELDALHFVENESGANFARPFANFIKRCEEINVKLNFIDEHMKKFDKNIIKCSDHKEFLVYLKNWLSLRKKPEHTYLEEVENEVDEKTKQLNEQIKNYEEICNKKNYCLEYKAVLIKAREILGNSAFFKEKVESSNQSNLAFEEEKDFEQHDASGLEVKPMLIGGLRINYLVGVIDDEDYERFTKMIFRVSKGNVISHFKDVDQNDMREIAQNLNLEGEASFIDPKNRKAIRKKVFLLIFTGGELNILKKKLIKICESFGVKRYEIPENLNSFEDRLKEANIQLKETDNLYMMTFNQLNHLLDYFSELRNEYSVCSLIEEVRLFILKEKCIYHHMNNLRIENNIFIGNVWIPQETYPKVENSLKEIGSKNIHIASGQLQRVPNPEGSTPPTYFKSNDFTWAFQEIVNTYGIPRYKEVNPGLFTTVTFPFLFGMMFGDLGHGAILFFFGLYLIISDSKNRQEKNALSVLSPGRYLFTMMGFFAAFCGLIYNEIFAFSINFFGSCYGFAPNDDLNVERKYEDCTYPFGLDPAWSRAEQEIAFNNSLKMKLSVIFGVLQMSFGVCLKGMNSIYFRKKEDFFFEFIPQILFMVLTFGWMDTMIIIKWITNWSSDTSKAPGLISTFMNMVLSLGAPPKDQYLWGDQDQQTTIQLVFLLIAVLCIPLMLIPKPIYLVQKAKRERSTSRPHTSLGLLEQPKENLKKPLLKQAEQETVSKEDDQELQKVLKEHRDQNGNNEKHHGIDHSDTGEIVVHQIIETIEFVLGSVSNTASYLRLWALSLAHSQLAKVFFDYGIRKTIENSSWMLFATYFLFANITFAVLMCMDVMECFLHALRLHWVEFQNKFYKADGYKYSPYSFVKVLTE